jgi:DNA-binding transcriptional LysR family regulator
MIDFEWYKVFYYIAKNMSITKASEELFITQPSVSITIKNLEESLGCKLFVRSRNGLNFTPDGANLYNQIQESCRVLLETETLTGKFSRLETGSVRISANEMGASNYLFPAIKYFREHYPNILFIISKKPHHEVIKDLVAGVMDMVIDIFPDTNNDIVTNLKNMNWYPKNIEEHCLLKLEDAAFAGVKYKHLTEKELDVEDLVNYPLIFPVCDDYAYSYYTNLFRSRGVECHPTFEVASVSSRTLLTCRNMGICFMPYSKGKREIREGSLHLLKLRQPLMMRKLVLLTSKRSLLGSAALKFQEILLRSIGEHSEETVEE